MGVDWGSYQFVMMLMLCVNVSVIIFLRSKKT
jgi:hypothetical protein